MAQIVYKLIGYINLRILDGEASDRRAWGCTLATWAPCPQCPRWRGTSCWPRASPSPSRSWGGRSTVRGCRRWCWWWPPLATCKAQSYIFMLMSIHVSLKSFLKNVQKWYLGNHFPDFHAHRLSPERQLRLLQDAVHVPPGQYLKIYNSKGGCNLDIQC